MILTPFTSNTVHRGGIFQGKQIFILLGGFRRSGGGRVSPCGASDFLNDEKVTKESPGDAAGANFVRHVGLPPDPHYEGYPLGQAK